MHPKTPGLDLFPNRKMTENMTIQLRVGFQELVDGAILRAPGLG